MKSLIETKLKNLQYERSLALGKLDFLIARIDFLDAGIAELVKQVEDEKEMAA